MSSTESRPTALITGGGGALADALRIELETHGWQVYAPSHAELDVTAKDQVQASFAKLDRLDLLVHNAGITRDGVLSRMEAEDFDPVLHVHLKGGFLCSQAALKIMTKARQGHIVHIGSFSALNPPIGQANYAAAKAALIGLTQSIAKEYGPRNIRANCVLPGFLDTPMTQKLLVNETHRERIVSAHALGRLNTCSDAARFIHFLHTMENISGQVFQLDSRISSWT